MPNTAKIDKLLMFGNLPLYFVVQAWANYDMQPLKLFNPVRQTRSNDCKSETGIHFFIVSRITSTKSNVVGL